MTSRHDGGIEPLACAAGTADPTASASMDAIATLMDRLPRIFRLAARREIHFPSSMKSTVSSSSDLGDAARSSRTIKARHIIVNLAVG
jgi:hypothetical protein